MKIFSRFTLQNLCLDFKITHHICSEWTILQYTSFGSPEIQFCLLLWWIFQNLSNCVIICNTMNSSGFAFSQDVYKIFLLWAYKSSKKRGKMQRPNLFQPIVLYYLLLSYCESQCSLANYWSDINSWSKPNTRSFFGRIEFTKKSFQNQLTFVSV